MRTNFKSLLADEIQDPKTKPILIDGLLVNLVLEFAKIKLYKNENDTISTTATLKNIKDDNMKNAIKYLYAVTARSKLYKGATKNNTRFCVLVPLFMSAHKEYNNINYERWDKNDPLIKIVMGDKLYTELKPHILSDLDDFINPTSLEELRKQALIYKGSDLSPTAWPRHSVMLKYDDSEEQDGSNIIWPINWKGTNCVRHMYLQTWMANVQHRNKFMILNPKDWDDMPESLDAYIPEEKRDRDFDILDSF